MESRLYALNEMEEEQGLCDKFDCMKAIEVKFNDGDVLKLSIMRETTPRLSNYLHGRGSDLRGLKYSKDVEEKYSFNKDKAVFLVHGRYIENGKEKKVVFHIR